MANHTWREQRWLSFKSPSLLPVYSTTRTEPTMAQTPKAQRSTTSASEKPRESQESTLMRFMWFQKAGRWWRRDSGNTLQ